MTEPGHDHHRHAEAAGLLRALAQAPCPDAALHSLALLQPDDLAALTEPRPRRGLRRAPARTPYPVHVYLSTTGLPRPVVTQIAADLQALAALTGAHLPALTALARPTPGGPLAQVPVTDRAALALLAPRHGHVARWDTGLTPIPATADPRTDPPAGPPSLDSRYYP